MQFPVRKRIRVAWFAIATTLLSALAPSVSQAMVAAAAGAPWARVLGEICTIGGLVHLVHQGVMKITLFFCAGNYAETLGIHKVSEMDGAGRRIVQQHYVPQPPDCPVSREEPAYLKTVWVKVCSQPMMCPGGHQA